MAEKNKSSYDELFAEVTALEKTVSGLQDNIKMLKNKLESNEKKYGPDVSKWPEK